MKLRTAIHNLALQHAFQLYGMALILIGLPWSPVAVSTGFIVIAVHAVLHPEIYTRVVNILHSPKLFALLALYAVYLLAMLYTTNIEKGLSILRIKLPLLVAPLVMLAFHEQYKKHFILLARLFTLSLFVHALAGIIDFEFLRPYQTKMPAFFVSYIRLSLMMVLAFFLAVYFAALKRQNLISSLLWLLVSVALLYNILYLKSLTAYMALVLSVPVYILGLLEGRGKKVFLATLAFLVVMVVAYIAHIAYLFVMPLQEWNPKTDSLTPRGNVYTHSTVQEIENGYYVGLYLCEPEMKESWNKISSLKYDSTDQNGNHIKYTLHRYLTYLHLAKNSNGVNALQSEQINHIESGYANPLQAQKRSIEAKIYTLMWELHAYSKGAKATGRSNALRLEYWKTSWRIIQKNPMFGVGTGDIQKAFEDEYAAQKTYLPPNMQLQSHNQWLSVAVSAGIPGVLALLLPFLMVAKMNYTDLKPLLFVITCILFISLLTEDMLNNQIGVSMYSIWLSYIFLWDERK